MEQTKLNKSQKDAVKHKKGPLLIIAGAGTGKTTVITERINWLITQEGISPSQILALTFTEKAAAEMEERVDLVLPLGYTQLWISTFHSFCDQILRNEAIAIGLNPSFKLLSEAESVLLLRRHLFELELDYFRPASNPNKFLQELISHFSRLRDEDITPKEYLQFSKRQMKKADMPQEIIEYKKYSELAYGFARYQKLKESEGLMDFADLIGNTLRLFRERPNVLQEYQNKFRYLLVDEFQDTNIAQNELLLLLSQGSKNITVVADDDQSIYKWRGAAVSNVIQFKANFPKAKIIVLTRNYRSTKEILDKSYQLIQYNNPDRLEVKEKINKKLLPARKLEGAPIELIFKERVEEEADAVALKIKSLVKPSKSKALAQSHYQFKDIAVLVRANSQADPFARALARSGIPYQFLGPGQLFHQPEIKDLIAYLKLLDDPTDNVACFRLCNIDVFGINPRDLAFIKSFSRQNNLYLLEALEQLSDSDHESDTSSPHVSNLTKENVKNLVSMLHRHLNLICKETGGQILYYFLKDSGLLKKYLQPKTEKEQISGMNMAKFFNKIKDFENKNKDNSVASLLEWINLRMEMGESPMASENDWNERNAINILTVHSAKGLEFPCVFIVNLVDRRFPTTERHEVIPIPQPLIKETLPEGNSHEQEERRLFYVAMTRAKDRLFLTAAKFYGEGKLQKRISPFVSEAIGAERLNSLLAKQNVSPSTQLTLLDWNKKEEATLPPNLNPPVAYLSFSQWEAYRNCPRQYQYKYNLKIPTPSSAPQTYGNTIHQTLKLFYQRQLTQEKKLTLDDLISILEANWSSEGFSSKSHEEESKIQALKMIKRFYNEGFEYEKIGNVLALEQPFSFRLTPTLKVGGVIDRIDNLELNKVEIIDYKTGNRIPSQRDVDENDQLSLYAMAISTIKDISFSRQVNDIVLSLYFLEEGTKISSKRSPKQIEQTKNKIINVAKELETTDFSPNPNRPFPCEYCEFRLLCDSWR